MVNKHSMTCGDYSFVMHQHLLPLNITYGAYKSLLSNIIFILFQKHLVMRREVSHYKSMMHAAPMNVRKIK